MNHEAIYALYPTVCSVDANGIAKDSNGNAVAYDLAAINAWVRPVQYKQQRALEYPSFPDQLDLLYHDRINNTDTWMEAIQAVKTKYPKS